MQIKRFLELSGEFVNTRVDNENDSLDNFQDVEDSEEIIVQKKEVQKLLGGGGYSSVEG